MARAEIVPVTPAMLERWPLTKEQPPGKRGKLTPETAARICELLSQGNYDHVAASASGVAPRTFSSWLTKAQDPETDPTGVYAEFAELVEQAQAVGEGHNVSTIKQAARTNWTAAAWLLERKYPERWGRRERVFNTVQGEHRVTFAFEPRKGLTSDDEGS